MSLTLEIKPNKWINLTALGGFNNGQPLFIENIGAYAVMVLASVGSPTEPSGTEILRQGLPADRTTVYPENSEQVWVKTISHHNSALLRVKDVEQVSPSLQEASTLEEILQQLKLLNARVEEAFETRIKDGDV